MVGNPFLPALVEPQYGHPHQVTGCTLSTLHKGEETTLIIMIPVVCISVSHGVRQLMREPPPIKSAFLTPCTLYGLNDNVLLLYGLNDNSFCSCSHLKYNQEFYFYYYQRLLYTFLNFYNRELQTQEGVSYVSSRNELCNKRPKEHNKYASQES